MYRRGFFRILTLLVFFVLLIGQASATKPNLDLEINFEDSQSSHYISTTVLVSPPVTGLFVFYIDGKEFYRYTVDHFAPGMPMYSFGGAVLQPYMYDYKEGPHEIKVIFTNGNPADTAETSKIVDFPYMTWGIPEFPSIAVPAVAMLGLSLIFFRKRDQIE